MFKDYQPPATPTRSVTVAHSCSGISGICYTSIKSAVSNAQAGDVITVKYDGGQPYLETPTITTATDGTPCSPIFLIGERFGNSLPVVRQSNTSASVLFRLQNSYWIVDGLNIDKNRTARNAFLIAADTTNAHHIIVRNSDIHHVGRCATSSFHGDAIQVSGSVSNQTDTSNVYLINNSVHDNKSYRDSACSPSQREDAHAIFIAPNASKVYIKGNTLFHNSGDGVQCQGTNEADPDGTTTWDTNPTDILIEDNHIYNVTPTDTAYAGGSEEAVDIKSCGYITVRGSAPPSSGGTGFHSSSHFHGFRPAAGYNGNSAHGGTLVVHYGANNLLFENLEINDTCGAMGVGRNDFPNNTNVVFRHNLVHLDNTGFCTRTVSAVTLQFANNVEVYGNTIDNVTDYGIRVAPEARSSSQEQSFGSTYVSGVRIWNNIFRNTHRWIQWNSGKTSGYESDYNIFYNSDGYTTGLRYVASTDQSLNLTNWRSATQQDLHSSNVNPGFASSTPANDGYLLSSTSPARNAGLSQDLGQVAACQGRDIGWIEMRESCSTCPAGMTSCNGTCVDLASDEANCGSCGNACAVYSHVAATCASGTCTYPCALGWGDCDQSLTNGCETALNTTTNCGECGNACSVAHGSPVCDQGGCAIDSCDTNYADCDQSYATGCEVNLAGDDANCGTCSLTCSSGTTCNGGFCSSGSCQAGTEDCDNNGSCETDLTTSVAHCGACGSACTVSNGTPACDGGVCAIAQCNSGYLDCNGLVSDGCETAGTVCTGATTIATAVNPFSVAVWNDTTGAVYWTSSANGVVRRSDKITGALVTYSTAESSPWGIAIDDDSVFWTNRVASTGTVQMKSKGNQTSSYRTLATGEDLPNRLAADASVSGYVYYSTADAIKRVAKSGLSGPTTIASSQGTPTYVLLNGTNVFWSAASDGAIRYAPQSGGTVNSLATGQEYPWGMATDGTYLYFSNNSSTGSIVKVPLGGGTPTVLAANQDHPFGVTVDSSSSGYVYWTQRGSANAQDGAVLRMAKSGGPIETLASGLGGPGDIGQDPQTLFWANIDDGAIMRVSKPTGSIPAPGTTLFSDNFDACTSTTNLGSSWSTNGTWYCAGAAPDIRARGESAGGIATALVTAPSDVTVTANITFDSSSADNSGVVARLSGTNTYYAARMVRPSTVQLLRVDNGVPTILATADGGTPYATGTSYKMQLRVSGTSPVQLHMNFRNLPVISVSDNSSSRVTSGGVGLVSGTNSRTQFNNFVLQSP